MLPESRPVAFGNRSPNSSPRSPCLAELECFSVPRIQNDYPDLWAARDRDKLNFRYPNGESYKEHGSTELMCLAGIFLQVVISAIAGPPHTLNLKCLGLLRLRAERLA